MDAESAEALEVLRDVWRARLEREGKLGSAGSLRDLMLRPGQTVEAADGTRG